MKILVSGKMGNGTLQAKMFPLSRMREIDQIYFLRKSEGPEIPKVKYLVIPKIAQIPFLNLIIPIILLIYYSLKFNPTYLIGYHLIPHGFFVSITSLILKRKYFICQTGSEIQNQSEKKMFWIILKHIILKAERMCVPGNISLNHWQCKGVPQQKLVTLHSTVDTDYYVQNDANKQFDFIYTGRFAKEKRIDFMINAFKLVVADFPNSKLILVGYGPQKQYLLTLIHSTGLKNNIEIMDFQKSVYPVLIKARFILLASEKEGLPCSIMEGMSSGLIPITTDVGNLSDIVINHKTGFISEKDDIHQFSTNLKLALKLDTNSYKEMVNNGRKLIELNHSYQSAIFKWRKLFII